MRVERLHGGPAGDSPAQGGPGLPAVHGGLPAQARASSQPSPRRTQVVAGVAALLFIARRIEPVWGSREFLTFVSGVNLCTGAATLALIYLVVVFTNESDLLCARRPDCWTPSRI